MKPFQRRVVSTAVIACIALVGCAGWAPAALPPGSSIESARSGVIKPGAEYPLPGGGTRLEFAQGSFGKQTFMLDFDAAGRLVSTQQVLTEQNFATVAPGLSAADLREKLGRPAQVFSVPWQKQHVWNYRYFGGDCVWFQVTLSDASQRVTESGIGTDPACDGPRGGDRD
jgi:hypothetical protein